DTWKSYSHYAVLLEFPVFVAIASQPLPTVIVPFICEPHSNAILTKRPHFLNEAIIQLAVPLSGQEGFNFLAPLQKFRPISPAAVGSIGERDFGWIPGIPGVFC